jgi:asparagine synthase (glutamine-hydrolysing)
MQQQSGRAVQAFSIGFADTGYDEDVDARAVAEYLGTDHNELYLSEADALDVVPMLGGMYDELFANSSQIPTYLVSKMARGKVTVALIGDGGDEIFGGYNRYLWADRVIRTIGWLPGPVKSTLAALLTALPPRQ